jgi:hypothetical protein
VISDDAIPLLGLRCSRPIPRKLVPRCTSSAFALGLVPSKHSAILRFESWRPSQQVIDLALFLRSAANAREERAFATSDVVCASQTRRKGVKFGVCLSGANLASVFVRENASRSYSLAPRGRGRCASRATSVGGRRQALQLRCKCDSAGAMQEVHHDFPPGGQSLKIARSRMRRAGQPNHRERVEVAA